MNWGDHFVRVAGGSGGISTKTPKPQNPITPSPHHPITPSPHHPISCLLPLASSQPAI
ncbi:MAG: hypothetical protein O9350_21225 [Microcystis sp. LE19-388.1G]|nr:hypothetical protein [Microcystis sp. LE19-388.1G]